MSETPTPGLYENVPFEDYLAWDAISNTRLNQAKQSLRHFKANPKLPDSAALRFGSLVHAGKLEPLSIPKLYAVMPDYHKLPGNCDKNGNRSFSKATVWYQEKVAKFEAANEGKTIVSQQEYDEMLAVVESISADVLSRTLLNTDGLNEVSLVWEDELTGILCKARIDKLLLDDRRYIVDLKTFSLMDASRPASQAFTRTIINRGYHRQMAHYCEGARVVVDRRFKFNAAIVAVDKSSPYNTLCAPVHEELLGAGHVERAMILKDIARAYETDEWPGYESPSFWRLPAWYESTLKVAELTVNGKKVTI